MCFCDATVNAPYCVLCKDVYEAAKVSDMPDEEFQQMIRMVGKRKQIVPNYLDKLVVFVVLSFIVGLAIGAAFL